MIHMNYYSDKNTTWFVTRHAGAEQWAAEEGLKIDKVVDHLDIEKVKKGDTVIGSLPVNMVALLNERGIRYFHLILQLPREMRGKHLSAEKMRLFGCRIEEYFVVKRTKK
jgi:CRISPR-associated protein Csx16